MDKVLQTTRSNVSAIQEAIAIETDAMNKALSGIKAATADIHSLKQQLKGYQMAVSEHESILLTLTDMLRVRNEELRRFGGEEPEQEGSLLQCRRGSDTPRTGKEQDQQHSMKY